MLAEALTVDFTRSFHDTAQCATFTGADRRHAPAPYVIHTRMEATEDGKVSKMESVVTDAGDWVFGASEHLHVTRRREDWGEIPADGETGERSSRRRPTRISTTGGTRTCRCRTARPAPGLRGGSITGSRNPERQTCTMGAFPQQINVATAVTSSTRTVGAVSIFHNFSWIDAGLPTDHPGTPASQTFRVEDGKNRYIHEVTVCTTEGCGRAGRGGRGGRGQADNRAKADSGAKVANRDQAHRSNRRGAGSA